MHYKSPLRMGLLALACAAMAVGGVLAYGITPDALTPLLLANAAGAVEFNTIVKAIESIEGKLLAWSTKADGEMTTLGKVSADTKTALDTLGTQQRELADRMLALEQKGLTPPSMDTASESWGSQVTKNGRYADFAGGNLQKLRVEVKNTVVGSDATVAPDRKPGVVGGAELPFSMERLLPAVPTSSNAIEFTRELAFTNNAAAASEAAAKAESSLTFELVSMPVSTIAHWIKISKQLAGDAPALAAYINTRMRYGVDQKVDVQLVVGDGVAPNLSGVYKTGNYVAHGYANAALGTALKKLVLIRKIMADLFTAGYPADAIVMNPADWATIEIELFTTAAGQTLYSVNEAGQARLFGVPVIQSIGMAVDTFQVGRYSAAATIHNREGVVVEMSDSDADNFTKNLITLRAERRLALAVERPAAIRGGDLTPA